MRAVALDVMSGDAGMAVAIAAARRIKSAQPGWDIILVGDKARIAAELARSGGKDGWRIHHADEVVSMQEAPARALRKRNTSMRQALQLVADGHADAAVSAGNTGVLMGLGVMVLRTIEGIPRPAIASFIPNRDPQKSCCMLDLGANVSCTPTMLHSFALMGAALVQTIKGKPRPRVGLLNIGEEHHKGSELLKEAAQLLQGDPHLNFAGNVEGYALYGEDSGGIDVIVCDGFSGNVALKVSEGLAKMITGMIKDAVRATPLFRLCAVLAYPLFSHLRRQLDPRRYNGASFLGLRGVVVKSHGNADEVGFAAAIETAIAEAQQGLPAAIARNLTGGGSAPAPAAARESEDSEAAVLPSVQHA